MLTFSETSVLDSEDSSPAPRRRPQNLPATSSPLTLFHPLGLPVAFSEVCRVSVDLGAEGRLTDGLPSAMGEPVAPVSAPGTSLVRPENDGWPEDDERPLASFASREAKRDALKVYASSFDAPSGAVDGGMDGRGRSAGVAGDDADATGWDDDRRAKKCRGTVEGGSEVRAGS